MSLKDLFGLPAFGNVVSGSLMLVAALMTVIQIAPVKIHPWDHILNWVGERINGDLQKEFRDFWVDSHRQTILTFCRECRREVEHSREEWSYILDIVAKYNRYCEAHRIVNGVIEEDTRYIRELYHDLCKSGKL